ncbi:single-stranded DNA-binding protein 3-like isoform X5 [Sipha flava]|uniref:Single-stranded DNA-binding protein 3-like isoform X5 n=1 Tax=Sipha flava TaxID=143950 RepID=A0A8B8FH20_9HEMI|nr:single-stranded DNA-binding protein 3-like isoform X5 [Sipha flava]
MYSNVSVIFFRCIRIAIACEKRVELCPRCFLLRYELRVRFFLSRLALYVYEYLLHIGAQKAAQTFLSEIRWEKNITLGEPPGFLHSWWCVFWDLYCAAPERRDTCEHSSEAKAFHDYGFVNAGYGVNGIGHNAGPSPSPLGQMPPNDGMPGGPMPGSFFPNSSMRPSPPSHPSAQQSPHSQPPSHGQMISNQPFMGPRYPGGPRPGIRMSQLGNDFNSPSGQPMMPGMDPLRQGEAGEYVVGWQGGMGPMNPRMNPPRGQNMSPLGSYSPGIRGPPPNTTMGPGGSGPNMPLSMGGLVGRPQWQPNANTPMSYSSSSPGAYGDFPMNNASDNGPLGPMGPNTMNSVLNGDGLDGMKNSPTTGGPGTPREDSGSGMGDYNLAGFGGAGENDLTESAAILKIKESMQEEAKRFEKDSDQPDYYIQ